MLGLALSFTPIVICFSQSGSYLGL